MNYYVYVIQIRARSYVGITKDYYGRMKKGVKSFRGVPSLYEALAPLADKITAYGQEFEIAEVTDAAFKGAVSYIAYVADSRASAAEYANRVIASFRKMGISLNHNNK